MTYKSIYPFLTVLIFSMPSRATTALGEPDNYNRAAVVLGESLKIFHEEERIRTEKAARLAPIVDGWRRDLRGYLEGQGFADEESSGKRAAKESFFKDKLTEILQALAPFQKLVVEGFLQQLIFINSQILPERDKLDALMNMIEAEGPDMRSAMNLVRHDVEDAIIAGKRATSL